MTDIRTAESAVNKATAVFERWREKFQAKFYRPIAEDAVRQMLLQMTPEQHMQVRMQDPDSYDAVMKKLGMKGG
jgi:hypothetical protein